MGSRGWMIGLMLGGGEGDASHWRAVSMMVLPLLVVCTATCNPDRLAEAREAAMVVLDESSPFSPVSEGAAQSREKLALIVAIAEQGEPATGSAYQRLNGPVNDVPLVSAALRHHGFPPENIVTLRDEQATKDWHPRRIGEPG